MALPDRLLALVAQNGVGEAAGAAERRFGPAEIALHRFVFGRLPRRAVDVRLAWDGARGQVVASFEPPPGAEPSAGSFA